MLAQLKKQLEDFPELAKRDVKELDWVKKKKIVNRSQNSWHQKS